MSREAYERMYGKPADIDKVWEDRDELHELTDGNPGHVAMVDYCRRDVYLTNIMWQAQQASGAIDRDAIQEQRRRRQRVMILGALLAVWYLMYRMVS